MPIFIITLFFSSELFYGGESLQFDHPSSYAFVCPHCGKLGFSETQLSEHVSSDHSAVSTEVVSNTIYILSNCCMIFDETVNAF